MTMSAMRPGGCRFATGNGRGDFPMRRIVIIMLCGVVLSLLVYFGPTFFAKYNQDELTGRVDVGGTSVVFYMVDKWDSAYRKEKKIKINYASTGSTTGITRMIDNKYAIAFTHAPISDEQRQMALKKGGEVLHFPVVLCAVVPFYNLKELKDKPPLHFDGEVLGDIFLGKIDKWNDPALKKLNEGVELPDTPITVVHRQDSSGTTLIFTDYLQGASARWKKEMGEASSTVEWPVGEGMERNKGVAVHVSKTDGAIGYVDLLFATAGTYGAVQNMDKTAFIHAEPENITAAAQGLIASIPEDLTFKLTNKPGNESYPISGGIWAVCYQNQPKANRQQVPELLQWIMHEGQTHAKDRSYAPLPIELVGRVEQRLKLIKTSN
jgi:phosphate ABC transporter phosphate-binding protein